MANELPEVVPLVQSMPTTGWIMQTQGSARRRITSNKSVSSGNFDTGGIYDVAGVPGHSHNASAVVAVDADYTRYRTVELSIDHLIWAYNVLNLPIGALDDSVEPDNASERYERAIERCIESISLFPENCTGNIHEPTRSIGEIRTLVTPKARLSTLTYIDERRGWRVPDPVLFPRVPDLAGVLQNNENPRPALVSQFPDVYVDVRPLQQVRDGIVTPDEEPASLYLDTPGLYRYVVRDLTAAATGGGGFDQNYFRPTNGAADIGVLSNGDPWDGTMRFVWDDDLRQYRSVPFQVTLHSVVELLKETGAVQAPDYTVAPGALLNAPADHLHRLSVEFPAITTTRFGGNAWISSIKNEETLNFAGRHTGAVVMPRIEVEVVGVKAGRSGPYTWVGMPAYRVPIGSAYAHPAPGYFQENMMYNHWDKMKSFQQNADDGDFDGFLRHQWNQQEQVKLLVAANAATAAVVTNRNTTLATYEAAQVAQPPVLQTISDAKALYITAQGLVDKNAMLKRSITSLHSDEAFNLLLRSTRDPNGGMHYKRSGGVLGQLTGAHYGSVPGLVDSGEPNWTLDRVAQYFTLMGGGNLGDANVVTPGLLNVMLDLDNDAADPQLGTAQGQQGLAARNAALAVIAQQIIIIDAQTLDIAAAIADKATASENIRLARIQMNEPTTFVVGQQALAAAVAALRVAEAAESGALTVRHAAIVAQRQAIADREAADALILRGIASLRAAANPDQVFSAAANYGLKGETSFRFAAAIFQPGDVPRVNTSDQFCVLPCTPIMYQLAADGSGNFFNANIGAAADAKQLRVGLTDGNGDTDHVPMVVCNCKAQRAAGTEYLDVAFDFTDAINTTTTVQVANLADGQGAAAGIPFFVQGYSLWLHGDDGNGDKSNFDYRAYAGHDQQIRNEFGTHFRTGNKYLIPGGVAGGWYTFDAANVFGLDANHARIVMKDIMFALDRKTDIKGLYFETTVVSVHAPHTGRKVMFWCPVPKAKLSYTVAAGGAYTAGRINTDSVPCYTWVHNTYVLDANGDPTKVIDVPAHTHLMPYAELAAEFADDRALDMYLIGPDWYRSHIGDDPYAAVRADSNLAGAVFQSIKRISQHVCAPVLNPNLRIGSTAPLNHDTRHLPPELRDFRLQLHDIDWGRLQAQKATLRELTTYVFKGGNQKQGAEQNVLYLPQFFEFKTDVTGTGFEFTCYSNLGSPSYYCLFCRSATTDILQQPLIKTLSIFNATTQKKSNAIQEMSIGQLYHLTQRNTHPFAEYDRAAYNRRQTILLSSEDVGLMGLKTYEYQKAKRVNFVFSGTCDRPGVLYVILVYNNRGLHIDGRRLQLVTLHE